MGTLLSSLLLLFGLRRRMPPYRPELHYMRGAGPKSREKLASVAR